MFFAVFNISSLALKNFMDMFEYIGISRLAWHCALTIRITGFILSVGKVYEHTRHLKSTYVLNGFTDDVKFYII